MAKSAQKGGGAGPRPGGHSRFGASGADRWIECPGSVQAQEPFPNETSFAAAEGTAGHEVAAMCLEEGHDAETFVGRHIVVRDYHDKIEITDEIAEAVQVYLDTIRSDKEKHGGKLLIERAFHLNFLDDEFWGTGDCGCFGNDNVIRIYDLKLGKGKVVEVMEMVDGKPKPNRQLCYYALGVISTLPKTLQGLIKEVELCIVQPRRPHKDGAVRRVRVSPDDLLDYCQDLVDAANKARGANPPRKAGDHCTFCRAAGVCPELKAKALAAAQVDFDDDFGSGHNGAPPEEMTNEELAKLLDMADLIESWIGAVRARAETLANGGGHIPGYKLVAKRATRRWRSDDEQVVSSLLFDFGLDESSIFVHKLKSPAQIEALLPKKSPDKKALAELYEKSSSGNKLAKIDDPREEVATTAQSDFDD